MGAYVGNRCTYLIGSKRKVQKSTLNKQTNKQTNKHDKKRQIYQYMRYSESEAAELFC